MRYGVIAGTRPDSIWGRTVKWCLGKDGRPLAFKTEEQARTAAQAFAERNDRLGCRNEYAAAPLVLEEAPWELGPR